MKKTIRIGYAQYTEEEVEVDDKFAEFIQQLEEAEANEDDETFDDLCASKQMDELISKCQWSYGHVVNMMLNTDKESVIYEN